MGVPEWGSPRIKLIRLCYSWIMIKLLESNYILVDHMVLLLICTYTTLSSASIFEVRVAKASPCLPCLRHAPSEHWRMVASISKVWYEVHDTSFRAYSLFTSRQSGLNHLGSIIAVTPTCNSEISLITKAFVICFFVKTWKIKRQRQGYINLIESEAPFLIVQAFHQTIHRVSTRILLKETGPQDQRGLDLRTLLVSLLWVSSLNYSS